MRHLLFFGLGAIAILMASGSSASAFVEGRDLKVRKLELGSVLISGNHFIKGLNSEVLQNQKSSLVSFLLKSDRKQNQLNINNFFEKPLISSLIYPFFSESNKTFNLEKLEVKIDSGSNSDMGEYPSILTQNSSQPVRLLLEAEKQIVGRDETGKEKVSWQSLPANAVVQPGDVIRYTLRGESSTQKPVINFAISQPIPKQTVYILNSATGTDARITYSIDSGKSFVTNPTIQVTLPDGKVETKPAPAEAYTHIRWEFGNSVDPAAVRAIYQVKVK